MSRTKTSERIDHEHALTGEKLALMAVFAHPEEESFGPAGTLARYASEGVRVSVVTVSRKKAEPAGLVSFAVAREAQPARDKSCSCLTSGTRRICLLDYEGGRIDLDEEASMEERLVRLIREQRPQVVITYGPHGLGDPTHPLISRLATRAFETSSDRACFPEHLADGLMPFQPQKLYYAVVAQSALDRWGLHGPAGVPDAMVTTVVNVTQHSEAKLRTLYCQRHNMQDFAGAGAAAAAAWDEEYFILAATSLGRKPRKETDLFAGLR